MIAISSRFHLSQKLLLSDAPPSHTTPNGLFLFADDDAQPSSSANSNAGANNGAAALGRLGVYLPDDALLRTCGLTGKVNGRFCRDTCLVYYPMHVVGAIICFDLTWEYGVLGCIMFLSYRSRALNSSRKCVS